MNTETRRLIVTLCAYWLSIIFILTMPNYKAPQETSDETFGPVYVRASETIKNATESTVEPTEPTVKPITTRFHPTMAELLEEPTEYTTEEPTEASTEPTAPTEPTIKYFDVPLSHDLQSHIFKLCDERGIDPAIIVAMIFRESSFNHKAIGDSGSSLGLMQIQPKWNRDRMKKLKCNDLLDPYQNITVGVDCFAEYYERSGSIEWSLMAYNGGPSYANRLTRQGRISQYVKNVLSYAEKIKGGMYEA